MTANHAVFLASVLCLMASFIPDATPKNLREERRAREFKYESCIHQCRQSCLPKAVI